MFTIIRSNNKFEYMVRHWNHHQEYRQSLNSLQEKLDEWGEEGWELISTSNNTLIFKRPKISNSKKNKPSDEFPI